MIGGSESSLASEKRRHNARCSRGGQQKLEKGTVRARVRKNFLLLIFAQKQESCGIFRFQAEKVLFGSEISGPAVAGRAPKMAIAGSERLQWAPQAIRPPRAHPLPCLLGFFPAPSCAYIRIYPAARVVAHGSDQEPAAAWPKECQVKGDHTPHGAPLWGQYPRPQ